MQDDKPPLGRPADGAASEGPRLVVRRAGIDDYSTIRHVQASAIRATQGRWLEPSQVTIATDTIYSPAYIAELIAKSLYVAVLNGEIVGTCAWSPSDDRGKAARIGALFVAPLFQGAGIGRQLIGDTERHAAQSGFSRFSVTVPVALTPLFETLHFSAASFGSSRDVIPGVAIQVAFMRKGG